MKININNLVVEVTRKCNMSCSHCLRGEAQNININNDYIDSLLNQVECINSITFSGGEPSLNVASIDYFLNKAKELGVCIGYFYIATNGLNIKDDFVLSCLKLYCYCDEKDMCSANVSNDIFHASEGRYNTELLDGLRFFERKHSEEAYNYGNYKYLIGEGNALENFGCYRIIEDKTINSIDDFDESTIYLNCDGNLISDCNFSYNRQNDNIICHVDDLTNFYESLQE